MIERKAGQAWRLLPVVLVLLLGGCDPQETKSGTALRTSIDELSQFITLTHRPKAVWWQTQTLGESRVPGPTDWQLVAVLEYDQATMDAILRQSRALPGHSATTLTTPEAFRVHGEAEATSCSPGMFARSPLLHGGVARLRGTNKLLLALYTM